MKKLLNWFYKTKLGELWLERKLLKKNVELEKELESITGHKSFHSIFQDTVQHKYQEGIFTLKSKINQEVARNNSSYEKILSNKELIELAREETEKEKQLRKFKEKLYVKKQADVISEVDKYAMIEKRIDDFYNLQRYNEEKELLRQIRQAKKNNDNYLVERLTNEWRQKFRPTSH